MCPPSEVNVELVETLLKAGALLSAICKNSAWRVGNTALTAFQMGVSVVVNTNNICLLRLFLQYGADPNVLMSSTTTALRSISRTTWKPIHLAVERLRYDCAKELLDAGAEVDAVRVEKKSNFQRLVEQDAEETPLHIACRACCYEGDTKWETMPPNARKKSEQEDATIAYALVELLLERGANVNAVRRYLTRGQGTAVRETALHFAVKSKLPNLTWLLVSAGADVNIPCQVGEDTQTAWEMCDDAVTRAALQHTWTPVTHHRHAQHVRAAIVTLLLVAQRLKWSFPTFVMHSIFTFIASGTWDCDAFYM